MKSTQHAGSREISAEEFTRIQGELMSLKIQNHDLMEELRRLDEGVSSTPSTASTSATASAAFKFATSTGIKMSSSAMTAFGAKGSKTGSSRRSVGEGVNTDEQDEAESLRVQVESLRARLESATRELKEAREAVTKAQEDESHGEATSLSNVDKLRRLIFEIEDAALVRGDGDDSHAELIGFASDALLLRIATAAREMHSKSKEAEVADRLSSAPDENLQQLMKIQKQQKDLEKLREITDKQQTEITALTETIAKSKHQSVRESAHLPTSKKPIEERLLEAQKKVEDLETQLNSTSGISRHTYELKCQLQSIEDKVHHRDQAIEKLRPQQEKQDALCEILQERVRFSAEDLRATWALEFELRTLAELPAVLQNEELAGSSGVSLIRHDDLGELDDRLSSHNGFISHGDDLGRQTMMLSAAKLKALQMPGCKGFCFRGSPTESLVDVFFKSKWDNVVDSAWTSYKLEAEPSQAKPEVIDVGVQSECISGDESPASGTPTNSLCQEGERLKKIMEDLKVEKNSIELRGLRELQDLRAQARKQKQEELTASSQAAAEIKSNGESAVEVPSPEKDDYAVVEVQNTSGMLYVQKIAELEDLNLSLGRDLELLQETEQCLMQDSREKDDLIVFLMQKAKLAELEQNSSSKKHASVKSVGGAAFSAVGNLFWGQGRRNGSATAIDELEHEAEEALHDNVRLRNDLRVLGEEYRKALAARQSGEEQLHSLKSFSRAEAQPGGVQRKVNQPAADDEEF